MISYFIIEIDVMCVTDLIGLIYIHIDYNFKLEQPNYLL